MPPVQVNVFRIFDFGAVKQKVSLLDILGFGAANEKVNLLGFCESPIQGAWAQKEVPALGLPAPLLPWPGGRPPWPPGKFL